MTKLAKSISGSETEQRIVTKNLDIVTKKLDHGKPANLLSSDTNIDIPKSVTSKTDGKFQQIALMTMDTWIGHITLKAIIERSEYHKPKR
jgi:hypothetical protein